MELEQDAVLSSIASFMSEVYKRSIASSEIMAWTFHEWLQQHQKVPDCIVID